MLKLTLFSLGIVIVLFVFLYLSAPQVIWLKNKNPTTTEMIRLKTGSSLDSSPVTEAHLKWIALSHISPDLIRAVILIEDDVFYKHHGFNYRSIYYAIKTNFKSGEMVEGGSTITQQLAKNLFLNPKRSIWRKIREAIITWRLEHTLTKERILELYLNVAEWGPGIYGIESASQYYFHKSASELKLHEALRLASILSNPILQDPLDNESRILKLKQVQKSYQMFNRRWIDFRTFVRVLDELNTPIPPGYAQALWNAFLFQQIVFLI